MALTKTLKQRFYQLLAGVLLLCEISVLGQTGPVNDDFENRITLTGSNVTFTGTLQNATLQPGESDLEHFWYYSARSASVWWSWTANTSGSVTIDVLNFSTNTFKLGGIDVWRGTNWGAGLSFIKGINLDIGRHPYLTFQAIAGTTYCLHVIGTNYGDFTLRITESDRPLILVQPASRTVAVGGSVFFGVMAAGNPQPSPQLSYQWRFDGADLPGETYPILGLNNLTTNESGAYSVTVSNAYGGVVSDVAFLNVTETAAPPQLVAKGESNGEFHFRIVGEAGRLYRVESSTNLVNWVEQNSFPRDFIYYDTSSYRARNGVVYGGEDALSVPQSSQRCFYRTVLYSPSNDVCINNLAMIRFAKELWSVQNSQPGWAMATVNNVITFVRSNILACPLNPNGFLAADYLISSNYENPVCKIAAPGVHVLKQPEQ